MTDLLRAVPACCSCTSRWHGARHGLVRACGVGAQGNGLPHRLGRATEQAWVVARVPTVPLNQRQGFSLKRTLDSAVATVAASSYSGAGQSIARLGVTERSVLLVSEGLDGE